MSRHFAEVDFLDSRAVGLRAQMSAELDELYGRPRHGAPAEDIDPESVIACLLVLDDDRPVATASVRWLRELVEIKRMFVVPEERGTALAAALLAHVEQCAARVTDRVVLHTGERQRAAIELYRRSGYRPIEVYPPYDQVPESRCFAKRLTRERCDDRPESDLTR